jgi:glutamate-1-semialdehyde aminotransferase
LRKLKATTSVYENLKSEQAQLYAELRKISKSKDLRLKVVSAVQNMVLRALQKSQSDLSHDEFETTVSNYINPAVLLRFLSTGRLDDTLSNMVLAGKTTVRFDPKVFIQAAMEV